MCGIQPQWQLFVHRSVHLTPNQIFVMNWIEYDNGIRTRKQQMNREDRESIKIPCRNNQKKNEIKQIWTPVNNTWINVLIYVEVFRVMLKNWSAVKNHNRFLSRIDFFISLDRVSGCCCHWFCSIFFLFSLLSSFHLLFVIALLSSMILSLSLNVSGCFYSNVNFIDGLCFSCPFVFMFASNSNPNIYWMHLTKLSKLEMDADL